MPPARDEANVFRTERRKKGNMFISSESKITILESPGLKNGRILGKSISIYEKRRVSAVRQAIFSRGKILLFRDGIVFSFCPTIFDTYDYIVWKADKWKMIPLINTGFILARGFNNMYLSILYFENSLSQNSIHSIDSIIVYGIFIFFFSGTNLYNTSPYGRRTYCKINSCKKKKTEKYDV